PPPPACHPPTRIWRERTPRGGAGGGGNQKIKRALRPDAGGCEGGVREGRAKEIDPPRHWRGRYSAQRALLNIESVGGQKNRTGELFLCGHAADTKGVAQICRA